MSFSISTTCGNRHALWSRLPAWSRTVCRATPILASSNWRYSWTDTSAERSVPSCQGNSSSFEGFSVNLPQNRCEFHGDQWMSLLEYSKLRIIRVHLELSHISNVVRKTYVQVDSDLIVWTWAKLNFRITPSTFFPIAKRSNYTEYLLFWSSQKTVAERNSHCSMKKISWRHILSTESGSCPVSKTIMMYSMIVGQESFVLLELLEQCRVDIHTLLFQKKYLHRIRARRWDTEHFLRSLIDRTFSNSIFFIYGGTLWYREYGCSHSAHFLTYIESHVSVPYRYFYWINICIKEHYYYYYCYYAWLYRTELNC